MKELVPISFEECIPDSIRPKYPTFHRQGHQQGQLASRPARGFRLGEVPPCPPPPTSSRGHASELESGHEVLSTVIEPSSSNIVDTGKFACSVECFPSLDSTDA